MNYLAHLYLAERNEASLIGNLMGDFVKDRLKDQYPPAILDGIRQHRRIDVYADAHPRTRASRNRFSRQRRRYAGIIVDVSYDHFLARHWCRYSEIALERFVADVYGTLARHRELLPPDMRAAVARMIDEDWLGGYRYLQEVDRAINRIALRCKRENTLTGSAQEVEEHYGALEEDFLAFFPDLVAFVNTFSSEPATAPVSRRRFP